MNFLKVKIFFMKIEKVWFDNDNIYIKTDIGHIIGNPLAWFPALYNATIEQRKNFRIGKTGTGIHWPELDEDLSLEGFYTFKTNHAFTFE